MEYLQLEINDNGKFDIPEEICKIENGVAFFNPSIKVQRSAWVCAIKKESAFFSHLANDDYLVYAVSVSEEDSSCLALDKAFDTGNYAEKGCGMTYGLSSRPFYY